MSRSRHRRRTATFAFAAACLGGAVAAAAAAPAVAAATTTKATSTTVKKTTTTTAPKAAKSATTVPAHETTTRPSTSDSTSRTTVATATSRPAPHVAPADITVSTSVWHSGVNFAGDTVFSGFTLEWRYTIQNIGGTAGGPLTLTEHVPGDAVYTAGSATCGTVPNCTVSYAAPFITWKVTSVSAGYSGYVSYEVTPKQGALYQHMGQRAKYSAPGCPNTVCYTNKVSNQVLPRPVSVASQTGTGTDVAPAQSITYLVQVKNILSTPANNVTVTNAVPAQTTLIAGSPSCRTVPNCSVSTNGSAVVFHFTSIQPHAGNAQFVSFNATVNTGAVGTITDTALWTGGLCAVGPCNTNVVSNVVGSTVSVTKSASASTVESGSPLTYTLTVVNQGGSASGQVVLFDAAPAGSTFKSGSASCEGIPDCVVTVTTHGVVQFSIPTVAAGATVEVKFTVVPNSGVSSLSNTATWDGNGCTEPSGCDTNTVGTTVSPSGSGNGHGGNGQGGNGTGSGNGKGPGGSGGAPSHNTGNLAFTGARVWLELEAAVGLLLLGGILLGVSRTRRRLLATIIRGPDPRVRS